MAVFLGVAIAGRTVPPARDDGATVEITRSASSMDGSSHLEIALYRAVWRVARAEGYRRLITHSQLGDIELGLREIGLRPTAALHPGTVPIPRGGLAPTAGWTGRAAPDGSPAVSRHCRPEAPVRGAPCGRPMPSSWTWWAANRCG